MLEKTTIQKIFTFYSKRESEENLEKFILEEIFEKQLMPELGYKKEIFRILPTNRNKEYYIQNTENEEQKIGLLISEGEILPKDEKALLNILDDNIKWGIITNGQSILLINKDIETSKIENWKTRKIVLEVRLSENNDISYLKYFTRDELFSTKNTLYFKDIAEYRNMQYRGNKESWAAYNSSLKRFFNYYITEYGGYYDGYEKFKFADFERFISELKVQSPATIVNIYAHISVYLRDKIGLRKNGFELSRKEVLKSFTEVKKEELGDILDKRRLMEINKFFLRKKNHQLRNLTIFYLSVCYGIERRQICQLRWKDISIEEEEIALENVKKPMPKQLVKLLKELKSENEDKRYPEEFVFYVNRNGKAYPITKDAVNNMFSSLAEIDRCDAVYTQYSPAKIRRTLAGILLKTLSLEDVMYLLSIEAENLDKYLTSEEIYVKSKENLHKKKSRDSWHPMEEVLEGVF